MSEAGEIVLVLNNREMHDGDIAAATGLTRQTVCKVRNGQQNGTRSLPALRKLLAVSSGEQLPELPGPRVRKDPATDYIEAEIIEPARPADIPLTIEETVIQLPHNYALTRAVTALESYKYKQWKREQAAYARYQREQVENAPSPDMSWIIDLFNIGQALFTKKLRPASPQQLLARAAALHQSGTPGPAQQQQQLASRWIPSQQFASRRHPTEIVRLAQPITPRPSSALRMSNQPEVPEAPYYGSIYDEMRRR
jgi:transcriptional regulator with XRE-family HTH domain